MSESLNCCQPHLYAMSGWHYRSTLQCHWHTCSSVWSEARSRTPLKGLGTNIWPLHRGYVCRGPKATLSAQVAARPLRAGGRVPWTTGIVSGHETSCRRALVNILDWRHFPIKRSAWTSERRTHARDATRARGRHAGCWLRRPGAIIRCATSAKRARAFH